MGPLLVGCVLGLISFSSIGLGSGFPGAGLNPARCFSTAVARGDFSRELEPFRLRVALTFGRSVDLVGRAVDSRLSFYSCLLCCTSIPSGNSDRKGALACNLKLPKAYNFSITLFKHSTHQHGIVLLSSVLFS